MGSLSLAAAVLATTLTVTPAHTPTPVPAAVHRIPVGGAKASGAQEHTVYGTIVQVQGNGFSLRARNGTLVHVDATEAITKGTFSAPLFVNKLVAIEGTSAGGTFHAVRVSRLTSLDQLPPDR